MDGVEVISDAVTALALVVLPYLEKFSEEDGPVILGIFTRLFEALGLMPVSP